MFKPGLIFLQLCFFLLCHAQPEQDKVALIGFYNLENLFDTINQPNVEDEEFTPAGVNCYNTSVYWDKLHKLSRVISEMGADDSPDGIAMLGVAEIENRSVLEDLVSMPVLKARNYQIAHRDGPDERGIDVALLYNPEYFNPVKMQSLHVPTEKIDSVYGYTRDILFVSGDLLGEPLHLFVNHWPSRRGGEEASRPYRKLAASVCRLKIDSLLAIDPHTKIIVMGDLNDDPVDESVVKILKAKGSVDQVKPGNLYNPWLQLHKNGNGSTAYKGIWNLFDQIIISSAWINQGQNGFFFKEAVIFKREYMIQSSGKYKGYPKRTYYYNKYIGGYSDHFPTYIVLLKAVN